MKNPEINGPTPCAVDAMRNCDCGFINITYARFCKYAKAKGMTAQEALAYLRSEAGVADRLELGASGKDLLDQYNRQTECPNFVKGVIRNQG